MLKNVAIPLMLAATEAEGQTLRDIVEEAMRGDREVKVDADGLPFRLQADSKTACDPTAGDLAPLSTAVGDSQAKIDGWQKEIDALENDGAVEGEDEGDWFKENATRAAAVKAAVEAELSEGVALKLNGVDDAKKAERLARFNYQEALDNFAQGEVDLATETKRLETATEMRTTLSDANDKAKESVDEAKEQHGKELLWREWLYCELGGVPADATVDNWWKAKAGQESLADEPANCEVPEVKNAAGDAVLRPAVTYYHDGSQAETKPTDGSNWIQWTATYNHE